jgi:hypothetical protein
MAGAAMKVQVSRVVAEAVSWLVVLRSSRYRNSIATAPSTRLSTGAMTVNATPVSRESSDALSGYSG